MDFLEEQDDDWGKPWHHLLAGSVAGVTEHCGMFPVDTVKTHLQAARSGTSQPLARSTRAVIHAQGYRGLWRGVQAMAAGAAPAHALFFGIYELCKHQFGGNMAGHHPVAAAAAGIFATLALDAVMTPMDAVKQRMQLNARHYTGMVDCIRKVRAHEGIRALYAGYTTTLTMNIPYHAVYFASYESYKKLLGRWWGNPEEHQVGVHIFAGGGAGTTAAAVTTPLDVAKTRLQTQGDTGKRYKGMVDAVRTIYTEEGSRGLMRGIRPRMLFHSTSAAICWATYEYMKHVLERNDEADV